MSTYLNLEGVSRKFNGAAAVDGVSLSVERGESVVLLGPSGCGKTTCLRMIAGFERPDAGTITLDGRVLADDRTFVAPERRNISVMFQSYALWPHMTVSDNVAFGPRTQRAKRPEVEDRVTEALEQVSLGSFGGRYPHELSGGQQQRVAMARALASNPSVLLLDEPLSNLDTRLREEMRGNINRVRRELGITMVYVTHDQSEALSLADRLVVMSEGRIAQVGTPEEVFRSPRTAHVATALGPSNIVEGDVIRRTGDSAIVEVLGGLRTSVAALPRGEEARVTASLRPRDLKMLPAGATEAEGTIAEALFYGDSVQYGVRTRDGGLVSVLVSGGAPLSEGSVVSLDIHEDQIVVLEEEPAVTHTQ